MAKKTTWIVWLSYEQKFKDNHIKIFDSQSCIAKGYKKAVKCAKRCFANRYNLNKKGKDLINVERAEYLVTGNDRFK